MPSRTVHILIALAVAVVLAMTWQVAPNHHGKTSSAGGIYALAHIGLLLRGKGRKRRTMTRFNRGTPIRKHRKK